MKVKEYLSQTFWINKQITSKLEQISTLRSLSMKVTASFGEEKVSTTKKQSPMEESMVKLIDLEHEINSDIDELIDLKREIAEKVSLLEDENHKLVLELRYIALKKWEDIAEIMEYDLRWVYKIHGKSIKELDKTLKDTIEV